MGSKHVVLAVCAAVSVPGVAATGVAFADDPAPTAGAASAEITARKGDRGRAVAAVQRRLRIAADGVFGAQTQRAVKRFQRRKRLEADGIVGPMTRRALRLRPFARGSVVRPRKRRAPSSTPSGGGVPNLPRALRKIALCESGGNPKAVSRNGRYRGKYQFLRSTWKTWGGRTRDPIDAGEAHQDRVAMKLYEAHGSAPWPSCG